MSNSKVLAAVQTSRELVNCVKKRKLQYFGHIVRQRNSLERDILLGMTNGERQRGRPKMSWLSNIVEWTRMNVANACQKAQDRKGWRNVIYVITQHREDE